MKLHESVVKKLLYLFETYGGHETDQKLRKMISSLEFTVYERKTTSNNENVLVLTEDYISELQNRRR
jgi:hypothetical protein